MTHYTPNKIDKTKKNQKWFTIPYINEMSHKFKHLKHLTDDLDAKTSYYSLNKLKYIIKGQKDNIPKLS